MPQGQTPTQKCREDAAEFNPGDPPVAPPCPPGQSRDVSGCDSNWVAARREASFVHCVQTKAADAAKAAGTTYCNSHFSSGSTDHNACIAGVNATHAAATSAANSELTTANGNADSAHTLCVGGIPCA